MPAAPVLPVVLDRGRRTPLPMQLASRVRSLVLDATLAPGDRIPSSRALAAELGVSRAVTTQAYEQLVAEGWLVGRTGAGTFVAGARLPAPPASAPVTEHRRAAPSVHLDTGTPWTDPRLEAGWRRAWREVAAARPPRGYDDPAGLPELRARLATHLSRTRGLSVTRDQVLVTSGTTDAWRALLAVLPAGAVAVEDPGYRAAVVAARSSGRLVLDLPATEPVIDLTGVVAVYVTPAHQHPLGATLPAAERVALLRAARSAHALVVEDDYDSEFRYDVAPVPALAAMDRDRVAYLGTASKAVAPSLRLGWMVAPTEVHDAVLALRAVTHEGPSWPVQRAFAALLRDGHVDRSVRSARPVYARRLARVAAAMAPHARTFGPAAGMYSVWLTDPGAAVAARDAARAAGFKLNLLADYCRTSTWTGLVIGVGSCTDDELTRVLEVVVSALSQG